MKKRFTFLIAAIMLLTMIVPTGEVWGQAKDPVTIYYESFGEAGNSTPSYSSYTGYSATTSMFAETGTVGSHISGDGKIGKSTYAAANLSSGYTGASGLSGCFQSGTANTTSTIIQVADIKIENYESLALSFGALGGSSSHKIDVSYIIDNGSETALISNGSITNANWTLKTANITGTGNKLTLIFKHKPTNNWVIRLDDIKVTGVSTAPTPTTYTITYKSGEGTGNDVTDTKNAGVDYTVLDKPDTFTAPVNKPTFDGWLGSDEVLYYSGDTYDTDEDLTLTALWVDDLSAPVYAWVKTDISGLYPDDVFVIVSDDSYALPNGAQTSGNPSVVSVTASKGKLSTDPGTNIQWNITGNAVDGYVFYPNGTTENWLYLTNNNKGVCVGTGVAKHFTLSDGYLTTGETTERRYIGVYNTQDWRCYGNTTGNISDQTTSFYKKVITNNVFETAGDWDDEANWSLGVVPTTNYAVTINAACEIPAGCVAMANSITLGEGGSITVANNGQLVCSNSVEVTMEKGVTAYSDESKEDWYTLSTPVHTGNYDYVAFANVENITANTYNVYYLNEATQTWMNSQNGTTGYNMLNNGRGYIYRNSGDVTLGFNGNSNVDPVNYTLTYTDNDITGFNLIGNPFTHNIYKGTNAAAIPNETLLAEGAYLLGTDGVWGLLNDGTAIASMQAVLVQAIEQTGDDPDYTLTIYNTRGGASGSKYADDNIWFTVKNAKYTDEACVKFKEGHGLNKVEHRNDKAPMLYIINEDEKFGVADMPDNTKVINLGFEAKTMGQYTISIKAEGQYSYMHLIDKLSGNDVDMLVEDSYTFVGAPNDRNDRFVLRLNYNAAGIDNESEIFAYQSGNDIIVSGEGDLQVFDVTGRMVKNAAVNGVETIAMPKGVYIFRLNEKVQKIVVR